MKTYNCDVCGELIYFENTQCLSCGSPLGYLPVLNSMSSLEFDGSRWKSLNIQSLGAFYRKCHNYKEENVCNWMVPMDDVNAFCLSCRLNEIIPDLSIPKNREYWHRLEQAKRRLVYSLLRLSLPLKNKRENPQNGLGFAFLADDKKPRIKESRKAITGHEQGKITINIAEADDAIREKMRLNMNERYRTLLGHFRHEIGHYYWFLLIEGNNELLSQFREVFGNEQENYNKALKRYYAEGAPTGWQQRFVSAYASSHPWEDWAESWAHYLHMFDTLETAHAWGLTVMIKKENEMRSIRFENYSQPFEEMRNQWIDLSCMLNSLNRSMGMKDVYPFVWSEMAIEKLRFIQQVIINRKEEVRQ
ncbi:MAG: putative zinc-binding metallopeptidase [Candidatus Scalindua rubra]|uniref:Zinc-ribbon domain-containing protein n=1 Tax=Candidatus Scalindua brodae TaxID=237368 RepID=A0A0B0EI29_9BACT|nr:MAG: hypothetical protein SCABRO_01992 [Candidatus Scalindua brodae]MBZ0109042.1 putative zinc-binding metallopeptidase [Candidatus Scalindua rubra]